MRLPGADRLGGLLLLAGLAFLVGLRPALRVVLREAAPELAVRVQALRDELDPWGRPLVAPGFMKEPGCCIVFQLTGPIYSRGPDGVDDTGARRAPAELWFVENPFPLGSGTPVELAQAMTRLPFDDRLTDDPAPAWDAHFRPLMAGDDVLVAWGTTPLVRLLVGRVEVVLGLLCVAAGWLLLLPAGPLNTAHRTPSSVVRRVGLSSRRSRWPPGSARPSPSCPR